MDITSLMSLMQYSPIGQMGKFFQNIPSYAGYAYGLLSDPKGTLQAFSDKYAGTHYGQSEMMQEQGAINSQLAQDERSWQERMLAQDRAYNSPANQLALMREAGLNPSLAYGQLSDMTGSAPSAGAASVGLGQPQYSAVPVNSLVAAQVENLRANSVKTLSEVPKNAQETTLMQQKGEEIKANIALLKESALAKHEEFNKLLNENNFFVETWASRTDLLVANAAKARLEARTFREQFDKQMQQADATINYLRSMSDLNESQKANLDTAFEILQSQKSIIEKQSELIQKYGNAKELLGMITQGLNSISSLIMSIGSLLPDVNIGTSKSPWQNASY